MCICVIAYMSKLTDRGVKYWTEYWTSTILTVFDRIQGGKNWTCTLLNLLYIHIITDPHCSIRWRFVLAVYHKVKLIHLKEMPELTAFITDTVVMLSHLKHCLYMKRISSCSLSSCPSARQHELSQLLLTSSFQLSRSCFRGSNHFFPLSKTKRISKPIRRFQTESVSEAWMHQYTSSQFANKGGKSKLLTPYSEGICFVMLKEEFC